MNKSQKLICLTKSFCHVGLRIGRTTLQIVKLDGKGPLFRRWSDYNKGRYGSVLASYHEIRVAHYGFGIVREYA